MSVCVCVCACLQSDLTFVGLKKKEKKSICKKDEIYLVKIVFTHAENCSAASFFYALNCAAEFISM